MLKYLQVTSSKSRVRGLEVLDCRSGNDFQPLVIPGGMGENGGPLESRKNQLCSLLRTPLEFKYTAFPAFSENLGEPLLVVLNEALHLILDGFGKRYDIGRKHSSKTTSVRCLKGIEKGLYVPLNL